MARRVPRLSESYALQAEYFLGQYEDGALRDEKPEPGAFGRTVQRSVWFYLMAAWFYEDEDEALSQPINHRK